MENNNYIVAMIEGRAGEDAKSKIMRAALDEFGLNSLDAARTRNIAKRAGVNHAAISYYFGGKEELYLEIARQIVEFIAYYDKCHYDNFEEVKKSGSKTAAKKLLKEILASRMCCEDGTSDIVRNIIMIIMREELNNGKIFDIFFTQAFKPISDMMDALVEIGSGGKYVGESARIVGKMLMGQVHLFNNARAGVKRSMGWHCFDEQSAEKVRILNGELIDNILG